MKTYTLKSTVFYSIKHAIDGGVFWRKIDNDLIEIRPIFKHIKLMFQRQFS